MSRKEAPRPLPSIASVDATGVILIGFECPRGSVAVLRAEDEKLIRRIIEPAARLAYDGSTLLVPGVPEAPNQRQAMDALIKWRDWVCQRLPIEPGGILKWSHYQRSMRPRIDESQADGEKA